MAEQVRGSTVAPARSFAEQYRGGAEWQRFMEALDLEQRRLLEGTIHRLRWYDLRLYASFIDVAASTLGGDDRDAFLLRAGQYVFDDGMNTLYRAFFRVATPHFVIRGSAMLWRLLFRGSQLVVIDRGPTSVRCAIRGATFCSVPLCISIAGGMLRALEHGGARNVRLVSRHCRCEGHPQCEFYFSW